MYLLLKKRLILLDWGDDMESVLLFMEQWWWIGLVITVLSFGGLWHYDYRRRQRKEFVLITLGCLMTSLLIATYIFSIIASLFSIAGFFLRYRHH